jgi:signal transduction histidine kinase
MLREFLSGNRDAIITRTRAKVLQRSSPWTTEHELRNGVPLFLDQLIEALGAERPSRETSDAIAKSAAIHGGDLLERGFTVAQVVYDYGDLCQAVTELADETGAPITAAEFQTLNRCLDEAIARAVTEYTRLREQSLGNQGTVRLDELAHGLRSRLSATMLSFDLLRRGSIGIGGSTGAALGRNLSGLRSLVDGALARARLDSGARLLERIPMTAFLDGVVADAAIDANIRGIGLTLRAGELGIEVTADRALLESAVSKLIQNAVKFSRPHGAASVGSTEAGRRVVIDIHDECGGFPRDDGSVRAPPGPGLSIARECVEAVGGILGVRDVAGFGCVYSIGLPSALLIPMA